MANLSSITYLIFIVLEWPFIQLSVVHVYFSCIFANLAFSILKYIKHHEKNWILKHIDRLPRLLTLSQSPKSFARLPHLVVVVVVVESRSFCLYIPYNVNVAVFELFGVTMCVDRSKLDKVTTANEWPVTVKVCHRSVAIFQSSYYNSHCATKSRRRADHRVRKYNLPIEKLKWTTQKHGKRKQIWQQCRRPTRIY